MSHSASHGVSCCACPRADLARRHLAHSQPPETVCAGLVADALKRGSTDNVSILLVRIGTKPIVLGSVAGAGGARPRTVALAEQRLRDQSMSDQELAEKARELKRQGKYVPRHLQMYLKDGPPSKASRSSCPAVVQTPPA